MMPRRFPPAAPMRYGSASLISERSDVALVQLNGVSKGLVINFQLTSYLDVSVVREVGDIIDFALVVTRKCAEPIPVSISMTPSAMEVT